MKVAFHFGIPSYSMYAMRKVLCWGFLFILFCTACGKRKEGLFLQAEQVWKMDIANADTLLREGFCLADGNRRIGILCIKIIV